MGYIFPSRAQCLRKCLNVAKEKSQIFILNANKSIIYDIILGLNDPAIVERAQVCRTACCLCQPTYRLSYVDILFMELFPS